MYMQDDVSLGAVAKLWLWSKFSAFLCKLVFDFLCPKVTSNNLGGQIYILYVTSVSNLNMWCCWGCSSSNTLQACLLVAQGVRCLRAILMVPGTIPVPSTYFLKTGYYWGCQVGHGTLGMAMTKQIYPWPKWGQNKQWTAGASVCRNMGESANSTNLWCSGKSAEIWFLVNKILHWKPCLISGTLEYQRIYMQKIGYLCVVNVWPLVTYKWPLLTSGDLLWT